MRAYIIRRLLLMIPVIVGVSVIIFIILRAIPGDAIDTQLESSGNLSPAERLQARKDLGLDKPILTQYWNFLGRLVHLDFGTSFVNRLPVTTVIGRALPVDISLAAGAAIIRMPSPSTTWRCLTSSAWPPGSATTAC